MNRNPQSHENQIALRDRTRVLMVAPSMDILGGQAVQAARLISRLRVISDLEVGFLPINPRLPGPLRFLQAIKYLRTIVTSLLYVASLFAKVHKYDVIHVFSASYLSFVLAPTPAIVIGKLFRKRVLLNYHSGEAADHLTRWPTAIKTIRFADEVVVPSEYLVKVFGKFGLKSKAINNLIELEHFCYREREHLEPRFLTNRNLETHYGVDCVLRAFAQIQMSHPEASLTVAGSGSQLSSLKTLSRQLGLQHVVFTGRVEPERIYAQYDAADVYLNGSKIDNQPLSILEAFACGIPVVTTNAGGITEMVIDGVTGFVVEVGDHQSMAAKAQQVLENSSESSRIAERAFEECQKYTWHAVSHQWRDLYKSLTRPKPADGSKRSSSVIAKLTQMRLAEARVRTTQLVRKMCERNGLLHVKLLTDDDLLRMFRAGSDQEFESVDRLHQHFKSSARPFSFPGWRDCESTIAALRTNCRTSEMRIIDEANRIVSGRFDLLGWNDLSFGNPINWHLEPVSGKEVPLIHWSKIDYLNPELCGDKKIVWELNRHQHFVKLGQAYYLTKNEIYAECFAQHIASWMKANPPKLGINWASSLEVAFRSISWLWALHFFRNSPALTSDIFARSLKFLYLNARHLQDYFSTYFSPNTHLTGEALGLYYLGSLLPEFGESKRWRETGARILIDELNRQVRPDGVYFEQSSYYQRYTVDFYTHFLILSRINGQSLPNVVEEKLQLLLDHLMYIMRPDGTTPLFGDEDGGRLLKVDDRAANDFRAALSNGASLFKRGDYKYVAGELAEETIWLMGSEGAKQFEDTNSQPPSHMSRAFPNGGFYVMRDSWETDANYLLLDCGPHGTLNCGHAHADALAVHLAAAGVTTLEDAGTYTYTGSSSERDFYRTSGAHNVVLVDRLSSSVPGEPFTWRSVASSNCISWLSEHRFDYIEAKHDGYERLEDPVGHTRSILFLKNDYWILRDQLTGSETHDFELLFHFAPELQSQLSVSSRQNETPILSANQGGGASAVFATFGEGTWQKEEGWISHCYGRRTSAVVWKYSAVLKGKSDLVTVITPNREVRGEVVTIRQVEAIGGTALEISKGDNRDLILIKDPSASRIQTVHLVSDFKWTWARFPLTTTEVPEELVVLDGRTLELNGKELLTSPRTINHLTAGRSGNKFRLETSEGSLDFCFPIANLDRLLVESSQFQN